MALDPLSAAFELGKAAIERIWPDENKRAEEVRKLQELQQSGELAKLEIEAKSLSDHANRQAEINLADAKSGNLFQAGWRPAVGWVSVVCLGLAYIPKFIVIAAVYLIQCWATVSGWDGVSPLIMPEYPPLDLGEIFGLLGSLLGFGTLRSLEKKQGTAK